MKGLRLIAAWIGGFLAAAALFIGAVAVCTGLGSIYTYLTHPTYAADVSFINVMVLFFAGPFIFIGSAVGGMFAGHSLNIKMQAWEAGHYPAAEDS